LTESLSLWGGKKGEVFASLEDYLGDIEALNELLMRFHPVNNEKKVLSLIL